MAKTELLPIRGCSNSERVGDIVFVHGLNGNPRQYWCHAEKPENYWPAWLGDDLPNIGIWSLGYENAAFKSRRLTFLGGTGFRGFAMPLTDRAENVLLQLKLEGLGTRPVVFITHSMGGLLVKQILRTANDSTDQKYRDILEQTRGVCFIATPHIGADLAKWGTYFRTLLGTNISMDELRPHEPLLRNLKQWYSNFVSQESASIKTLSFYEMKPLPGLGVPVVEAGDADPGVPLSGNYPLDADHSSICRPDSRKSPLYREIHSFIKDCFRMQGAPPDLRTAGQGGAPLSDGVGVTDSPWPPGGGSDDPPVPVKPGPPLLLVGIAVLLTLVVVWRLVFPPPEEQKGTPDLGKETTSIEDPIPPRPEGTRIVYPTSEIAYEEALKILSSGPSQDVINYKGLDNAIAEDGPHWVVWTGQVVYSKEGEITIQPLDKVDFRDYEFARFGLYSRQDYQEVKEGQTVTLKGIYNNCGPNGIFLYGSRIITKK